MSDTLEHLRRKISSATELQSVVRTMKALAAANIGQYEQSVRALSDYYHTVELGLHVCSRYLAPAALLTRKTKQTAVVSAAVVFGSDQGLVGRFNEEVADYAVKTLAALPPGKLQVWAVGERVYSHLMDADLPLMGVFNVPTSVKAITALVGRILVESETLLSQQDATELHLFYNRPAGSIYGPVCQRLLPLDEQWLGTLADQSWPTGNLPEVIGDRAATLRALIREYLFVSLFRACAESLASENSSRLAAMQRADQNIDELLENFHSAFHQLRQSGIDEELFDVISGYEALAKEKSRRGSQ